MWLLTPFTTLVLLLWLFKFLHDLWASIWLICPHVTLCIPHMSFGIPHITFVLFLLIITSLHPQMMWQDTLTHLTLWWHLNKTWLGNDDMRLHGDGEFLSCSYCWFICIFMIYATCSSSFSSKRLEDLEPFMWSGSYNFCRDLVSLHFSIQWSSCLHSFPSVF